MKNGIRITMDSIPYASAMIGFVFWMDKTFPHLNGDLSIMPSAEKGVTFRYQPYDSQSVLTPMDKALIRKKWSSCESRVKMRRLASDRLNKAIALIESGQIQLAIRELLTYNQIIKTEEF